MKCGSATQVSLFGLSEIGNLLVWLIFRFGFRVFFIIPVSRRALGQRAREGRMMAVASFTHTIGAIGLSPEAAWVDAIVSGRLGGSRAIQETEAALDFVPLVYSERCQASLVPRSPRSHAIWNQLMRRGFATRLTASTLRPMADRNSCAKMASEVPVPPKASLATATSRARIFRK